MNTILQRKLNDLVEYELRRKAFSHTVTLEDLKRQWLRGSDQNVFNDYVANYLKEERFNSHLTFLKYRTFQNLINEYNAAIPFTALNEALFQAFGQWLQVHKGQAGQTSGKYFEVFKKVVRKAWKEGYLANDPFDHTEIKLDHSKKREFVVLNIDEINLIRKLEINEASLARTRDHFLFCFYAGFYYSDLCALEWPDVKEDPQFGPYIESERFKTDVGYIAPVGLFPEAVAILDRQRGNGSKSVFQDAIDVHVFNRQLKRLAKLAGINKPISNKTARRSMIQFMQSQGLEPVFAQRMAGHTKFSTTEAYFRLGIRDIGQRITDKINLDGING